MKPKIILTLLFIVITAGVQAAPELYRQDVHYRPVNPVQPTASNNKVEIIEFLWYDCRTCFMIQHGLEQWVNENKQFIDYRRIPAITNEDMMLLARAFYAAEALGVHNKIHKPLFTAIHQHGRRIVDERSLAEFFSEHGVENKDFHNAFRSSEVSGKIRRANVMSRRYGIQGAPTIIVNGKFRVDSSMVTSPGEFIDVIDFLVKKENSRKM